MLEFGKALEEMERHIASGKSGYKEAWAGFRNAERSYDKAVQIRERLLQTNLEKGGLAVCSGIHGWEGIEHPSAEQMGIYPRTQMRLVFVKFGPYDVQGEYEVHTGTTISLHLLCPEHFPQQPKWKFEQKDGFSNIDSEVVIKDGKFILTVNEIDITRLVKEERDMEPDGKRLFLVDPEIYRYFGIPDLPAKPNLDAIRFGV